MEWKSADEDGFCFEKGKLTKGKPLDFFKQVMYRSPIHDEGENNPHGMGDYRVYIALPVDLAPKISSFIPVLTWGTTKELTSLLLLPGVVVFANETDMGFTIIIEHDVLRKNIYGIRTSRNS